MRLDKKPGESGMNILDAFIWLMALSIVKKTAKLEVDFSFWQNTPSMGQFGNVYHLAIIERKYNRKEDKRGGIMIIAGINFAYRRVVNVKI